MTPDTFISKLARSIPPSGIRRFFDIAATMEDVISLGIGEPDFDTPAPIVEAGIAALQRGATHYTSNSGLIELRQALAAHIHKLYGLDYDPTHEILVTVGVSEALYLAMAALLDPGDEIIFAEPCFVAYEPTAVMVGATPVAIPTTPETGFQLTAEMIEAAITEKTKVLFLASPNNPTGAVINRERLTAIAALAEKYNLVVLSDEIYDRLVYGVEHVCFATLPGMRERTIVLQGFSKAYAMTGWRVGYLLGPETLVAEMRKLHQYLIMSAPTVSQWAALKALEVGEPFVQEMHARYERRRKLIVGGLNDIGLMCIEPHGAFYAFPCIQSTGMDDNIFAERLLQEERVAVIPGRVFGPSGAGFVRMSYATAYDKIEVALERIAAFVQRCRVA
ncbi:MAG TPA: aminotransferase class I/II-fold pyridoxal phosphate-dependent enzyme [Anaerolineae bacterium]|nr:aminotransferase class I/II-fold pyridoxal phosphate-dependent enzyme [Anaerolineae bacterium]HQI85242.1 aminotransferase class I/II-fold pyridoxal phosphate-dependent enzyme [Anaerolineae bacterium]